MMASIREVKLTEKYQPRLLSEVLGQGAVVDRVESFVAAPHSHAFLFAGPTGAGKSTIAQCIANELGCHPTSGLWVLDSGCQTEEDLDAVANEFRFAPMNGGWRVVVVEEADWMSRCPKAAMRWLSILDHLPTRTVFVFTTNEPHKFSERFADRCERIDFAGQDGTTLIQDAQLLVDRVWHGETGRTDSPRVTDLPRAINAEGFMSFRRVVQDLEPIVSQCEPFTLQAKPQAPVSLFQAAIERNREQPVSRFSKPETVADAYEFAMADARDPLVKTVDFRTIGKPKRKAKPDPVALPVADPFDWASLGEYQMASGY